MSAAAHGWVSLSRRDKVLVVRDTSALLVLTHTSRVAHNGETCIKTIKVCV